MAQFKKSIEIWPLTAEERARLQPGQHITAGGSPGRWCGQTTRGIDVAAWRAGSGKGMRGKMKALIEYARASDGRITAKNI